MNAGKLLNVFDKGVAMLVAAREAREYEDCGTGVSAESFKRGGHLMTISLNDLTVKELDAKHWSNTLDSGTHWQTFLVEVG